MLAKKHILVVEDEPDIMRFYQATLPGRFILSTALTGREAIAAVRRVQKIDLVVLDYKLSDMSGLEVLKEIKKTVPSVPVLVVTAFGDEDVAVESFRLGARDYLKKPIRAADLINRIQFYLSLAAPKAPPRTTTPFEDANVTPLRTGATSAANMYKIQNALKFINDNFVSKISQASVARTSCLSQSHFSRIFKKATGMTFQAYLNKCRIEKAQQLLKLEHRSITDVAFSSGYSDLTHFERMFRKHTGLTPSQYRILLSAKNAEYKSINRRAI